MDKISLHHNSTCTKRLYILTRYLTRPFVTYNDFSFIFFHRKLIGWICWIKIFSINIKGTAGGLVTLVNWAGAWAVSYSFNFLLTWSSYGKINPLINIMFSFMLIKINKFNMLYSVSGTFLLYAAVNVACILFVVKLVPETKGKTLEEIQAAINHHWRKYRLIKVQ